MAKRMTIGEVAKKANLKIDTIRFYEKQGLIPAPLRRASGYRSFDEGTVRRLEFIRRAKDLGFSLQQIDELLSLRVTSRSPCHEVRLRANGKIADIDEKIRQLTRIRGALVELAAKCEESQSTCPLLDALDN